MFNQKPRNRLLSLVLLTVLTLILSVATGRYIFIILLSVGLIAATLPFKRSTLDNLSSRLIFAVIVLFFLFQVESIIFWLVDIWASTALYSILGLSLVLLAIYVFSNRGKNLSHSSLRPRRLDILLLLPASIIGTLYVARVALPESTMNVAIVQSVNFGMDDITHANIFSDMLRYDNNLLAGQRSNLMNKSVHSSYPMGWHIATGIVTNSILGHDKDLTGQQVVNTYFYVKVATFMLTILSLSLFVYAVFRSVDQRFSLSTNYLLFLLPVTFVSGILILPLFFDGFFSFLPIIMFTLLFATLLISKAGAKKNIYFDILLIILAVASSVTWILTAPLLMFATLLYFINDTGGIKKISAKRWGLLVTGSIPLLFQIYILIKANKGSLTNIANPGGIVNPTELLLPLVLIAFFLLMVNDRFGLVRVTRALFGTVFAFLASLALLILYISLKSPELTYYYYKIQSVLLVILCTVACIALIGVVRHTFQGQKIYPQLSTFAVSLSILIVSIPSIVGYSYFYNLVTRIHESGLTLEAAEILSEDILSKTPSSDYERIYFVFPDQAPLNILGSNTAKLMHRSTACDYDVFNAVYKYELDELSESLNKCVSKLPLIVLYTDKGGKKELSSRLNLQLIEKNEVSIRTIE